MLCDFCGEPFWTDRPVEDRDAECFCYHCGSDVDGDGEDGVPRYGAPGRSDRQFHGGMFTAGEW
jgi:hypothetical protein